MGNSPRMWKQVYAAGLADRMTQAAVDNNIRTHGSANGNGGASTSAAPPLVSSGAAPRSMPLSSPPLSRPCPPASFSTRPYPPIPPSPRAPPPTTPALQRSAPHLRPHLHPAPRMPRPPSTTTLATAVEAEIVYAPLQVLANVASDLGMVPDDDGRPESAPPPSPRIVVTERHAHAHVAPHAFPAAMLVDPPPPPRDVVVIDLCTESDDNEDGGPNTSEMHARGVGDSMAMAVDGDDDGDIIDMTMDD